LQKGYHIRVNLNQVFEVNQGNYVKSLGGVGKTHYFCFMVRSPGKNWRIKNELMKGR
jgi:hypothetical protein